MNAKILVVDDDAVIRDILKETLLSNDFTPVLASGGVEGLESVKQSRPDVIILDWKMPDMDGKEVLTRLKQNSETQNIPIIMLTAKCDVNDISQSLTLGAADYIVKPFDCDNMIMRLKKVLSKEETKES